MELFNAAPQHWDYSLPFPNTEGIKHNINHHFINK